MNEQTDDPYPPIPITEMPDENSPDFDMDKYMEMAKDFDMSEEEKHELLTILWDIMKRFVELGFGLDSVSILGQQISQNPSEYKTSMVEYSDNKKTK